MTKTKRSQYTLLQNDFLVADHKLKRIFRIKVMVNTDALLLVMGPLALSSRFGHNKQVYGPLKVEVRVDSDPSEKLPKAKRTRKKQS